MHIPVPTPFDFESAITAHGWPQLASYRWSPEEQRLHRIERLETGRVVPLAIAFTHHPQSPSLQCQSPSLISPQESSDVESKVRHIFRLDEDFSEFYALCRDRGHPWNRLINGKGRLLRSPTVFEDIVKTICTTNTTWSGTIRMVSRMVDLLGESYLDAPTLKAFPTPEAIASASDDQLKAIGLGYRGAYIRNIARQIMEGILNPDTWHEMPTPDLKKQLLRLKGVGNYAAHTLLMLLGRYEELAIDSEMRAFTRDRYFEGRTPTDQEMRSLYSDWGCWKYLAYWFDCMPETDAS